MIKFQKFIPLEKVEAQSDGSLFVYGLVTAELPDQEDEVCDYETSKPYYKALTEKYLKATSAVEGMEQSIAPLREMHQLKAIGCGKSIDFDDSGKTIHMGFKVVDADAITKFKSGVLIGFSQGGEYVKTWQQDGKRWYTADPGEISAVDSPCLSEALVQFMRSREFTLIEADGSTSLHKFTITKAEKEPYGDVEYADPGYQSDKKKRYPVDTEEHIRAAWSYINHGDNAGKYSSSEVASIKRKIIAAWKKHIDSGGPPSADKVLEFGKAVIEWAEWLAKGAIQMTPEQKAELEKNLKDLEKAKSTIEQLHGHFGKLHKSHAALLAHREKGDVMHKAHAEHLAECMKCMKTLGGGPVEGEEHEGEKAAIAAGFKKIGEQGEVLIYQHPDTKGFRLITKKAPEPEVKPAGDVYSKADVDRLVAASTTDLAKKVEELNKQLSPDHQVKTFMVPRPGEDVVQKAKADHLDPMAVE